MNEARSGAVRAMSDAVLAIAGERSVDTVLQRIVHAARELAGARYAALGVPDGEGAFARFITSGMTEEEIEAMGPLPRTHGLLGAMLESEDSYRTLDIKRDPRFRGWWPSAHPQMASFLGVPIVARGEVIGAFYLTDKERAEGFSEEDQELIEMLAPHAAVAMENARLYERSRELSIVEERNRLARELHDSLVQKLFGVVLAAQSAGTLLERDSDAAREQVERLQELAQEAVVELRSLVFQLRPAELETEGLGAALRKHVELLGRAHRASISARADRHAAAAPGDRRGGVPDRAGVAPERAAPLAGRAHRAAARGGGRRAAADGVGRRRRLRAGGGGPAVAPARPDLDGGARPRAGRPAADRLRARARDHDRPGGGLWRRSAS